MERPEARIAEEMLNPCLPGDWGVDRGEEGETIPGSDFGGVVEMREPCRALLRGGMASRRVA